MTPKLNFANPSAESEFCSPAAIIFETANSLKIARTIMYAGRTFDPIESKTGYACFVDELTVRTAVAICGTIPKVPCHRDPP